VDAIDDEILGILRDEARISFSDLGRRVGLSANAATARVRRLERDGVIVAYRAVLAGDEPSTGPRPGLEGFVDVRLREETDSDAFLAWARREPLIEDAAHVTGPYDYLLRVRVRDTAELDRLLRRLKSGAGVAQTQTRLALR
jgi:Lrp/AsnC family leucine-responsive transcriptional regulator